MSFDEEPGRYSHDECRLEIRALAARVAELDDALAAERNRAEKAEAFKSYVHRRLDEAGIPVDPESPHREQGCRIGGRLDLVLAAIARAERAEAALAIERERAEKAAPHSRGCVSLDEQQESIVTARQQARAEMREEAAKAAYGAVRSTGSDDIVVSLLARQVAAAIRALPDEPGGEERQG